MGSRAMKREDKMHRMMSHLRRDIVTHGPARNPLFPRPIESGTGTDQFLLSSKLPLRQDASQ